MTALLPVAQSGAQSDLQARAIESALAGLAPSSRRVYQARIAAWLDWAKVSWARCAQPLDREHLKKYIRALELSGTSAQVQNQALAALKRLAVEAAELGWIEHNAAVQIQKIKSKRITGIRTGRWLTAAQCGALLTAPDRTTVRGRRDAAVLALLVGCGLRRAEACGLETAQLRSEPHNADSQFDRTIITNLVGKGGRIRSVAVPGWAAQTIEEWRKEIESCQS
jgi:site-specific recombinase XerD